MAPLRPVKKDGSDKRVQAVLEAAKKILSLLQDRTHLPSNLEAEIDDVIKRSFPIASSSALATHLSDFDSLGCEVWNAATNIIRTEEQDRDPRGRRKDATHLTVLLRAFAFLLVDTAQQGTARRAKSQEQLIRNLRIGLKAARFCLDKGYLDFALKVLERCAEHVSASEDGSPLVNITTRDDESDNRAALKILTSEFYLLRMAHAWKSERLDLAEHFFGKVSVAQIAGSTRLSEKAAELYYEAGKSLSKNKLTEPAMKWLDRALAALNACDIEQASHDVAELRLGITAALVETILAIPGPDSIARTQSLVQELEVSFGLGNRMAVQLMQLNIILADKSSNHEQLRSVMSKVLRPAILTEHTFKIIMQSIHRVRKANTEIACYALGELINYRLLPDLSADSDESLLGWIEKACITFTLFATSDSDAARAYAISELESTLNAIAQRSGTTLSPKATHAAQTLIWKAAGAADPEIAERWCFLLRHALFDSAGQVNKARIGRKAITMALARNDINAAREAFFQMSAAAQNETITRYIAFKLALRSDDYDLAIESLNFVMKHADRDATFLYACVLEAQRSQMRHIAVAALHAILDKQPAGVHLPSLLRCTARLLIGELGTQDRSLDEVAEEIVRVFENAASNKQALQKGSSEQWRAEIQWWTKNAYNLALRLCGQVHPEYLVRLLRACNIFIDSCPKDDGPMHNDDLKRRQMLCHFLSATALIVLGRSTAEESQESLQYYLEARREIEAFRQLQREPSSGDRSGHTMRRLFELLKFELECVLNLQQWDQLDGILTACLDMEEVDRWDALADVVLVIHRQAELIGLDAPSNAHLAELLQRIINETWQKDKDIVKASRWLRLSFSYDLNEGTADFALKLLGQAASMARKGYEKKSEAFPETELQWVATTAFNKAVDLLSSGLRDASMTWIDRALELARYADDNGALHANLTHKREQAKERMLAMEKAEAGGI